jgi:Phosphoribosyl transferase domain
MSTPALVIGRHCSLQKSNCPEVALHPLTHRAFAKKLNDAPLAIVDKRRSAHNVSEVMNLIGDVRGKVAVLVDDMIDTAGTITNAAKVLKHDVYMRSHCSQACSSELPPHMLSLVVVAVTERRVRRLGQTINRSCNQPRRCCMRRVRGKCMRAPRMPCSARRQRSGSPAACSRRSL